MGESLGVDIGGVIVPRVRERDEDTALRSDFFETQPIPEAFEVLRQLVDHRFGNRVFIVSKAGPRGQAKTRRWLKHDRFYAATGIKPKHVHFCLERHHKAGICGLWASRTSSTTASRSSRTSAACPTSICSARP